jgi:hypothetical protein
MIIRIGLFYYLLVIIITVGSPIVMIADAYAQRPEESLDWSIETSKRTFYAGEPALLTLTIRNTGEQQEQIDFGADAIEAFSMEIRDNSNKIAAKGGKIQRFGLSRVGTFPVPPGQMTQKSIVLNQWCSTLLPPGRYRVICHVEYRLRSEDTKIPGTEHGFKAGPLHTIELDLNIQILEMDRSKFKKILEDMARREVKTDTQSQAEWLAVRRIAREMITFAESDLGVPYQLHILRVAPSTWLKWDVINSLVRSETLEAAEGLVQIIEDSPECGIEDVRREIIDAVYRLRETGKSDIMNATKEFILKYKRPRVLKPQNIGD